MGRSTHRAAWGPHVGSAVTRLDISNEWSERVTDPGVGAMAQRSTA